MLSIFSNRILQVIAQEVNLININAFYNKISIDGGFLNIITCKNNLTIK